jgi:glutamyl-tRNA reductase
MHRIVVVGLDYKSAPVELRERLAFSQSMLELGLEELYSKRSVRECAILSTCNRVEVYAVSDDIEECVESIREFLSDFHRVSLDSFAHLLNISIGHMAIRHLFSVASSIDSMVIGEPQILGQVKQAYKSAVFKQTVGLILNRLFHGAFFVAKKVRAQTKIGAQAVSVSYVAVELAKRIFDDLSKRRVMLVGAGDMGQLAARHLINSGIRDLIIASRRYDNSESLASKLNGNPISMDEVYYFLKETDIVITATGSSEYIIKPHHMREALKLRNNEPIFMIDIAVPRDIDPRVEEISNIYLYDIDDLRGVTSENMESRRENAKLAEDILLRTERNFQRWLNGLKVVPTIVKLRNKMEIIKEAELRKALDKLGRDDERLRSIIESMASGIVGKILHHPLTNLKRESSTSLGTLYMDSMQKLFELDNEFKVFEEEEDEADVKDWEQG